MEAGEIEPMDPRSVVAGVRTAPGDRGGRRTPGRMTRNLLSLGAMRRVPLHQRILDLLRAIPAVDCQNRLMRVSDREIAFSLLFMEERDRDRILSLTGRVKAMRIREEVERIERSRYDYRQYEAATSLVIRAIEGSTARAAKSYYRPTRTRTRGSNR